MDGYEDKEIEAAKKTVSDDEIVEDVDADEKDTIVDVNRVLDAINGLNEHITGMIKELADKVAEITAISIINDRIVDDYEDDTDDVTIDDIRSFDTLDLTI